MLVFFAYLLCFLCLSGTHTFALEQGEPVAQPQSIKVLVIDSFHIDQPWDKTFDEGFIDGFQGNPTPVTIYREYLDAGRIPPSSNLNFPKHLETRYSGLDLDVIVAESIPAVNFLQKHPELLKGTRRLLVPSGGDNSKIEEIGPELLLSIGNDYGKSFQEMLRLADPKQVYVIVDTLSPGGQKRLDVFKQAIQQNPVQIPIEYLPLDTIENMKSTVATLPPGSAIYYLLIFRDAAGHQFTPYQAVQQLAEVADAPIFSYWDSLIGSGIVGGYLSSAYRVGELTAHLILKLEKGQELSLLQDDGFGYFFDWRQLKHWGIPLSKLPEQSRVLYRQLSFYEQYKLELSIVATIILVLLALSSYLFRNIQFRKKAEKALKEREEYLHKLIEESPIGLVLSRMDGSLVTVNSAYAKIIGYSIADTLKLSNRDLTTEQYLDQDRRLLEELEATGRFGPYEKEYRHKDGHRVPVRLNGMTLVIDGENLVWSSVEDISVLKEAEKNRQELEEQLRHSQKMEAIGTLAGGIAHDFNNLLTAILGHTEISLRRLPPTSPAIESIKRIEQATERAADLAKQMLAYSGRGQFVIERIDLNELLEEMLHMLQISISKKAVLRLNPHTPLAAIEADATQIRQVIMNLVINASEAIGEDNGEISITTGCMDCDKNHLKTVWRNENLEAGQYVYLEVADTGCGMDADTLNKLFDPFFTTKFTGRGLGMSAVMGIVRGHRGAINVTSEPGKGTTFRILLPATDRPAESVKRPADEVQWAGCGIVLLVDDEESIRSIGVEILNELGLTPLTAVDGQDALQVLEQNPDICLVILDLTMPRMDGEQCYRELKKINPAIKVIMASGYSEREVSQKFYGEGISGFIQKPYNLSALREAIRKVL